MVSTATLNTNFMLMSSLHAIGDGRARKGGILAFCIAPKEGKKKKKKKKEDRVMY